MIKLQDFAKQMGVTDRAIQKHLIKYADEFEGLYQRKGPNGTWLSNEACEILRTKMRQQPMVVSDGQVYRDLEAAKRKIEKLQEEKAQLAQMNSVLSEWKAENSLLLAEAKHTQFLLDETSAELKEVKAQTLELATEKGKVEQDLLREQQAREQDNAAKDEEIEALRNQLMAEQQRRLTWKERFFGRKENKP